MTETFKPRDEADLVAALSWASDNGQPVEIRAGGSKRTIGRPVRAERVLDLTGFAGVTLYEPEELVLSARAATPIAEIHALLAASGQELAFEPIDYGPLLGAAPGAGTIGGALAANLAGPRRIKAGAARDHFLGVKAVSGRGEAFKSGGRVMKNVTGYDLAKGLAGSWGTLAAMTEVTVKVMPRAETEQSLVLAGLSDADACRAMSAALGSPFEISAAAHIPAASLGNLALPAGLDAGSGLTVLRIEGFAPSVESRIAATRGLLAGIGAGAALDEAASRRLWADIRDVRCFAGGDLPVWRVSTAPTNGPRFVAALAARADIRAAYDWGGGLIWLEVAGAEGSGAGTAGADLVRAALAPFGGHATLVRASEEVRAHVPVFQPQSPELALLSRRYKMSFDPKAILNRGRMYEGV